MDMDFGLIALVVAFSHLILNAIRSALNRRRLFQTMERVNTLEWRLKTLTDQCNSDHDKVVDLEIELNNVR